MVLNDCMCCMLSYILLKEETENRQEWEEMERNWYRDGWKWNRNLSPVQNSNVDPPVAAETRSNLLLYYGTTVTC